MESSSPTAPGRASDDDDQQRPQQPLSAIAQQAYDRYGNLDTIKLYLMVRGIFITREDAAALPNRITPDGCPEVKAAGAAHHHQQPCVSYGTTPRRLADTPVKARTTTVAQASPTMTGAPSVASSSHNGIGAVPSGNGKWTEGEVKLLVKLRAERVRFRYIADRYPSKNQKALQEKFYKVIKDTKDTRWKQLYDELRARHDGVRGRAGTFDDPFEILDEDAVNTEHTGDSSDTPSETTNSDTEEDRTEEL